MRGSSLPISNIIGKEVKIMKKEAYYLTTVTVVSLLLFYPISSVLAQKDYPSRPIEVIIASSPGGPSDLSIRYFGEKWSE